MMDTTQITKKSIAKAANYTVWALNTPIERVITEMKTRISGVQEYVKSIGGCLGMNTVGLPYTLEVSMVLYALNSTALRAAFPALNSNPLNTAPMIFADTYIGRNERALPDERPEREEVAKLDRCAKFAHAKWSRLLGITAIADDTALGPEPREDLRSTLHIQLPVRAEAKDRDMYILLNEEPMAPTVPFSKQTAAIQDVFGNQDPALVIGRTATTKSGAAKKIAPSVVHLGGPEHRKALKAYFDTLVPPSSTRVKAEGGFKTEGAGAGAGAGEGEAEAEAGLEPVAPAGLSDRTSKKKVEPSFSVDLTNPHVYLAMFCMGIVTLFPDVMRDINASSGTSVSTAMLTRKDMNTVIQTCKRIRALYLRDYKVLLTSLFTFGMNTMRETGKLERVIDFDKLQLKITRKGKEGKGIMHPATPTADGGWSCDAYAAGGRSGELSTDFRPGTASLLWKPVEVKHKSRKHLTMIEAYPALYDPATRVPLNASLPLPNAPAYDMNTRRPIYGEVVKSDWKCVNAPLNFINPAGAKFLKWQRTNSLAMADPVTAKVVTNTVQRNESIARGRKAAGSFFRSPRASGGLTTREPAGETAPVEGAGAGQVGERPFVTPFVTTPTAPLGGTRRYGGVRATAGADFYRTHAPFY